MGDKINNRRGSRGDLLTNISLNSRGQVTIFIILGILIVFGIILTLYYTGKFSFITNHAENPEAYLKNCMMTSAKEAENIILNTNGYPQTNSDNYLLYKKEKIPYMCTVSEFYTPCIPQEPAFFNYIKNLMQDKISKDTQNCINILKGDFEKKGYTVSIDPGNITLKIVKDFVSIKFGKKFYASRGEEAIQVADISADYETKLYDLINLEQTIVNYESILCGFDKMNWMRFDSSIIIDKTSTSDQTKVYTLTDRLTEREIKFAIKTCVLPAGI